MAIAQFQEEVEFTSNNNIGALYRTELLPSFLLPVSKPVLIHSIDTQVMIDTNSATEVQLKPMLADWFKRYWIIDKPENQFSDPRLNINSGNVLNPSTFNSVAKSDLTILTTSKKPRFCLSCSGVLGVGVQAGSFWFRMQNSENPVISIDVFTTIIYDER